MAGLLLASTEECEKGIFRNVVWTRNIIMSINTFYLDIS
jgi:hypothetical protein